MYETTMRDRTIGTVVLRTKNLTKHYGGVEALTDVDFEICTGDVVALVGDNGAGKSTFAKLISGAIAPTSGTMEFLGNDVSFKDPAQARELGIEAVYQDLALVPHIDVGGNLFLGREPAPLGLFGRALGLLDLKAMRKSAWESLERLKVKLPSVSTPIGSMSGGQRQATSIARSVLWGSELIIMDEPVAALGVQETEEALKLVEDVASHGVPLIIISHNLEHVFRIANRIIVFRLGGLAADVRVEDTSPEQIVGYITGATKAQAKADK